MKTLREYQRDKLEGATKAQSTERNCQVAPEELKTSINASLVTERLCPVTGRQEKTSKPLNIFGFTPLYSKGLLFLIHSYGPCLISEQFYNLLLELKEGEMTLISVPRTGSQEAQPGPQKGLDEGES